MNELNKEALSVIEHLGGNSRTAEICEVTKAAVSQWRHNGIPKTQRLFLQAVHPEAFGLPRRRKADQVTPP